MGPQESSHEEVSKTGAKDDLAQKRSTLVKTTSSYLNNKPHTVWKPKHRVSLEKVDLQKRREQLLNRVWATHLVLREQSEGDTLRRSNSTPKARRPLSQAAENATTKGNGGDSTIRSKITLPIHNKVSQYARAILKSEASDEESTPNWATSESPGICMASVEEPVSRWFPQTAGPGFGQVSQATTTARQ